MSEPVQGQPEMGPTEGEVGVRRWTEPYPGTAPFRFSKDPANIWLWKFVVGKMPDGVDAGGHCWPSERELTTSRMAPLKDWLLRICLVGNPKSFLLTIFSLFLTHPSTDRRICPVDLGKHPGLVVWGLEDPDCQEGKACLGLGSCQSQGKGLQALHKGLCTTSLSFHRTNHTHTHTHTHILGHPSQGLGPGGQGGGSKGSLPARVPRVDIGGV